MQWLHDPDREGALNLVEHVGERDRRIADACTKPIGLLPEPTVTIERETTVNRRAADPVERVPVTAEPGPLYRVPVAPPGYVHRSELTEPVTAIAAARSGAVGVTR